MNAIAILLMTIFSFASDAAVPRPCTELGCESGVFIDLEQKAKWAPGLYQFRFILDGRELRCEGELPLAPCGTPSVRCDRDGVVITESGCALPSSAQGFGRIKIDGFPAKLAIEVKRDEKRLGLLRSRPVYTDVRPNGPRCEPLCRQAQERIELK